MYKQQFGSLFHKPESQDGKLNRHTHYCTKKINIPIL